MCGIAGILYFEQSEAEILPLKKMLDRMAHRGPDDRGEEEIITNSGGTLHLGHQRLSIIDLSQAGHQPMANDDKSVWLSTNSEIYNYKELRQELQEKYQFKSQSDTEVLLRAYEEWGEDCLDKIRGMFAFAIWDSSRQVLFLARDRLGIKPLYYYSGKNFFAFASETRALQASGLFETKINPAGLYYYLSFGRLQSPHTLLTGIKELEPANSLRINPESKSLAKRKYWSPFKARDKGESGAAEISKSLEDAVRVRMMSDVTLGSFLSGGIDSSAVTGMMTDHVTDPLKTLSVTFKEKQFDESEYSRMIADQFGTDHKVIPLAEEELLDHLPHAIEAMDQPTIDGINTYIISHYAKEYGMKVALSGLGGDELFAGYESFKMLPRLMRIEKFLRALPQPVRNFIGGILKKFFQTSDKITKLGHLVSGQLGGCHPYFLFRALFCEDQARDLFKDKKLFKEESKNAFIESQGLLESNPPMNPVDQISYLELTHYMANMLLRDTDMMSMAHGLEVRVPLVDHQLVELMFTIPGHMKMDPATPKHLLVNSLTKKLPDQVVNRKKMGFTLPFQDWMRGKLKEEMERVLFSNVKSLDEFISETAIRKVWQDFLDNKTSWSRPWSLYVLKRWVALNLESS